MSLKISKNEYETTYVDLLGFVFRNHITQGNRDFNLGFRLVLLP